jgi:hypothetical protein
MKYQAGSPVTDPVIYHFSFIIFHFVIYRKGQRSVASGPWAHASGKL